MLILLRIVDANMADLAEETKSPELLRMVVHGPEETWVIS
jgi:hypothetical protein